MAAGVHLTRDHGAVGVGAQFLHGQGIHVGAQGDTGSLASTAEDGDELGKLRGDQWLWVTHASSMMVRNMLGSAMAMYPVDEDTSK